MFVVVNIRIKTVINWNKSYYQGIFLSSKKPIIDKEIYNWTKRIIN